MKTENTLENKAKFFAQYWGQNVLMTIVNDGIMRSKVVGVIEDYVEETYLELTPLSDITDEDALWLGRDANEFVSSYEDDLKYCKELVERMVRRPHLISQKQGDYLRSKGYALPWLDTTVKEQIEYGWVRLKQIQP